MTEDKLLNISEVAKYLKIPKSTIYKLSQRGEFPSCKIGKQLRFRKSSLDSWLLKREGGSSFVPTSEPFLMHENQSVVKAPSKRVLVVDDDELVLKTLSRFLKIYGYVVESAQSGEDAIKKSMEADFDLIIADVRMPGMDGLETLKRIRELKKKKKQRAIPEIVITGYMDSPAEKAAQDLGVADYIHKPFFISELLNTVKEKISAA